MWNNYFSGRPSRNLPPVNYVESSDEELEPNPPSPLASPRRPINTRPQSPVPELRVFPSLADNVDEVLEQASHRLNTVPTYRPDPDRRDQQNLNLPEEVVEGHVVGGAIAEEVQNVPVVAQPLPPPVPPVIMPFEDDNGEDDAGALGNGLRSLEKLQWDDTDLAFFFNRVETRMGSAGIKKNFTKFQVLSEILPTRVQNQVKGILRKSETDFPQNNAYKVLKTEILRIFGPKLEDAVLRALSRIMSGLPSELARDLVDDIGKHELNCECCPAVSLIVAGSL